MKNKVSYKKVLQLLLEHNKIKLIMMQRDYLNDKYTVSRERVLMSSGGSIVRYIKHDRPYDINNLKFSRYETSCFREEIHFAMKLMKTTVSKSELLVEAMKAHDSDSCLYIHSVYAGKGFRNKIA